MSLRASEIEYSFSEMWEINEPIAVLCLIRRGEEFEGAEEEESVLLRE